MSRDTKRTKPSRINFFKRLLFLVKVEGESGWPELIPGKTYYATCLKKPVIGSFVVFRNPQNPMQILVKKVFAIKNGGYEVGSLVSWGSSSKELGLIPQELILGSIIRIFKRYP